MLHDGKRKLVHCWDLDVVHGPSNQTKCNKQRRIESQGCQQIQAAVLREIVTATVSVLISPQEEQRRYQNRRQLSMR